jgi:hypothetical protein
MNLEGLHKKLIAAARANPPSDAVPYAFEKRIMARLAERPVADAWLFWGRALWRAAAACLAVTAVVSALSFASWSSVEVVASAEDDFESTVFAAANVLSDSW